MKLYYDCEFLEDGRTIELISIGMVAEDGRELYAVCEEIVLDPLYSRICEHNWLMENVIPHLPISIGADGLAPHVVLPGPENHYPRKAGSFHLDMDSLDVLPRRVIRNQVREFIDWTPDAELWAWYGAYDHVALAQLFGRMIDLPPGVPMWTNDLKQECHRLGDPDLPDQPVGEHNALEDARHLKVRAEWLAAREASRA